MYKLGIEEYPNQIKVLQFRLVKLDPKEWMCLHPNSIETFNAEDSKHRQI